MLINVTCYSLPSQSVSYVPHHCWQKRREVYSPDCDRYSVARKKADTEVLAWPRPDNSTLNLAALGRIPVILLEVIPSAKNIKQGQAQIRTNLL